MWHKLDNDNMTSSQIYSRGQMSENTTNSVKWNKSGSKLIAGGRDGIIRLYDIDNQMRNV